MTIFAIRYRRGWFGRLIVQVQVREMQVLGGFVEPALVWRDARVEDLPKLEVRS